MRLAEMEVDDLVDFLSPRTPEETLEHLSLIFEAEDGNHLRSQCAAILLFFWNSAEFGQQMSILPAGTSLDEAIEVHVQNVHAALDGYSEALAVEVFAEMARTALLDEADSLTESNTP